MYKKIYIIISGCIWKIYFYMLKILWFRSLSLSPGLSWDAILKMTGVALEKISDPDKKHVFEQGMGGGLSCINKRYSET